MNFGYIEESKESKLERKLKKAQLERFRREKEKERSQAECGEATGHHYPYSQPIEIGLFSRTCSICGYVMPSPRLRRRGEARAESPQATSEN